MTQRSIEIDADKCDRVAQMLGTTSDRETIDMAFDSLLARREPRELDRGFVASVTSGHYVDFLDEKVITTTWWERV